MMMIMVITKPKCNVVQIANGVLYYYKTRTYKKPGYQCTEALIINIPNVPFYQRNRIMGKHMKQDGKKQEHLLTQETQTRNKTQLIWMVV